jgi:glycosyltransferase involved in cell wall biosynthesis
MAQPSLRSVLFVTPRWRRDGGIAAHAEASAAALADEGLEVRVLTAHAVDGAREGRVEVLLAPRLTDRDAPVEARLGHALTAPPDVIHLHQLDDPDVVRALRRLAPVVISAHGFTACTSDVYYFGPGEKCTRRHGPGCIPNLALRGCAHTRDPRPLPGAYRATTRAVEALRLADLAVAHGSAVDSHLAANGIEPRCTIPLFTTLEPVQRADQEGRRRVLFAGRVVPPKGLHVLVHAAREVDAEFVVCGEGWQLPRIQRLARRLGVAERFSFRGWLEPQELAGELAQASVVALPSLWPEPFGLVGIEALASSRPVVASATGGIPDWLDDGVSGLLVKPGDAHALADALNELLGDPQRRRAMGEAGRVAVAERFSRERHVEAILGAYRQARETWRRAGNESDREPV